MAEPKSTAYEPVVDNPLLVSIVGVYHWAETLASTLSGVAQGAQMRATSPGRLLTVAHRSRVVMRVGFRPGALTVRGTLFDLMWIACVRRRKRATYWIGTDVVGLLRTDSLMPHRLVRPYRALVRRLAGRSAAGAPWLAEELLTAGVVADVKIFPDAERLVVGFRTWPTTFRVSAYVPRNKPEFYGLNQLLVVAARHPEVGFDVYGGYSGPGPQNVLFYGMVNDFAARLADSVVHLRLTEHDSLAGTVRQAMAIGRYVVFGYDLPGVECLDVHNVDGIVQYIDKLSHKFREGHLAPNELGMAFITSLSSVDHAYALAQWSLTPT